jgi:hypothetical protein
LTALTTPFQTTGMQMSLTVSFFIFVGFCFEKKNKQQQIKNNIDDLRQFLKK